MIRHQRIRPPHHDYPADEWNVIEKNFRPEFLAQMETIMALGNGYLGMRGCPEEGGPTVENSTLINGFYETHPIIYGEEAYGFAKTGQTICNVTDTKVIKLFVDDEPFWLPKANLLSYDRRLNMKAGTLDRDIVWETPAGKQVRITSRRMVSLPDRHVAAISYSVTLLNTSAHVVIASEMAADRPTFQSDTTFHTIRDPREPTVMTERVLNPVMHDGKERRIMLGHVTQKSGLKLVCACDHTLVTECKTTEQLQHADDVAQVAFVISAQPNQPIHLSKYMVYHTSQTAAMAELCGRADWTMDRIVAQGFTALLAAQQQFLDAFWRHADVRVRDIRADFTKHTTVEIQQAIRFNLFQIMQASARAEDTGVPAKGLTGQGYEGHYFWDTEIYLLPFLIYTQPWIAKNLLMFRYRMLPLARERAKELGHRGAMFPWRTINGEEASAFYAAGTAQYHINADIMYALRKYVLATGDVVFLERYGAEMLVESARLWADLGFFADKKGGQYCINAVTGPDEYNTVVNNSAYTNLMARENLRYAVETVQSLRSRRPEAYIALVAQTGLVEAEVDDWVRVADNMYIPYDETLQIIPQHDDFLDDEPWDFANTPEDHYPLLLFYHPLNIYRKQVLKQADVVLALFLLGDTYSIEEKRRNFEFYDPLTTGDSSLSSCVEAIIAAQCGKLEKATEYAMAALLMDLDDIGGNVKAGCHIASMGGTWMVFAYGFAGLRDYHGILSFYPRRGPDETAIFQFPLNYRGRVLEVEIGMETVEYTLRRGDNLMIHHEGEAVELTREQPKAIRQVTRW